MAAETSVVANEGGFAAGRDQTINFAPSPELVAALTRPLEQLNEYQRKEIKDLRDRLGTSDGILHRVVAILTEHLEQGEIDFDRIPRLLIELVKHRQAAVEQERTRPQDPDSAFAELQKKLEKRSRLVTTSKRANFTKKSGMPSLPRGRSALRRLSVCAKQPLVIFSMQLKVKRVLASLPMDV